MSKSKPPQTPNTPLPPRFSKSGQEELSSHHSEESAAVSDKKQKFSPDTMFQIQHGVVSSEIDEELIVGDLLGNKYFRMNSTGAFIWSSIKDFNKFSDLVDALRLKYELESAVAEETVSKYLTEAIDNGILASTSSNQQVFHLKF